MHTSIHLGDSRDVLRGLPPASVDAVITCAPRYQRGELGAHLGFAQDPRVYVQQLVELFKQALNLLTSHGVLWLCVPDARGRWPTERLSARSGAREIHEVHRPSNSSKGPQMGSQQGWLSLPGRVAHGLVEAGYRLQEEFVWSGPEPASERSEERVQRRHRSLFLFSKGPSFPFLPVPLEGVSDKAPLGSVWRFPVGVAGFSLRVVRRALLLSTTPGQMVLDPFAREGVVGRAAMLLGRRFLGIELDRAQQQQASAFLSELRRSRQEAREGGRHERAHQ